MKKQYYLQFNQFHNQLLNQKDRVLSSLPNPQFQQHNINSYRKTISQTGQNNPLNLNSRPFIAQAKINQHSFQQFSKNSGRSQNSINHEQTIRVKSNSFHQKNDKSHSKFEYLAFVQKQYRGQKQKQKQGRESLKQSNSKELSSSKQLTINTSKANLQDENRFIKSELRNIKERMQKYFLELQKKDEVLLKKDKELLEKSTKIEELCRQIQNSRNIEIQYGQLVANYNYISEKCARYQNDEDYYAQLGEKYSFMVEKCTKLENILQQKQNIMQNTIQSKNDQYKSVVTSKANQIKFLENRILIYEKQNQKLAALVNQLQNRTINEIENDTEIDKFTKLGQQFQFKINFYVEENMRLRNVINQYEGTIQQLKIQKGSLEKILEAFDERDQTDKTSRINEEMSYLREKLQSEKQEKDHLVSKYQLKILKLENNAQSKKLQTNGSLIDQYDRERLHQSLYNALDEIQRLKQRLADKSRPRN